MKVITILKRVFSLSASIVLAVFLLGAGGLTSDDLADRVRAYTRNIEFNFVEWTVEALIIKLKQLAVGSENYLTADERHQLVQDYLELVYQIRLNEFKLDTIYADPAVEDPEADSSALRQELSELRDRRDLIAPVAEAILQEQVSEVASESGLTLGGQPIPPVLYHSTTLPWALIVSPRETISMEADINLAPEVTVDQHVKLEDTVDKDLDVSSLVVGIGGIGLYPTMVDETFNLSWLSEVVGHEWAHNFLTLRPLGVGYMNSPEMRTMNETAASIAGTEIGQAVVEKYYPELLPEPTEPAQPAKAQGEIQEEQPPVFDFYQEMHQTRVETDRSLAEGKVDEAEEYMEQRREVFWENGYQIRKLNQAWFAFHGAYADQPGGGAAGEDPVGAAVRELRAQSSSLSDFLNRISWMSTFEQLQRVVESNAGR